MTSIRVFVVLTAWLFVAAAFAQQTRPRWNEIRGVNYFTASARNAHDMWRHFDASAADRELSWASGLGFNSVRLWLSVPAFEENAARFQQNLRECLDLCEKHQLTAMLVLFDSCGIEPRPDAAEIPVHEAYARFLASSRWPPQERELIAARYGQFAAGRGQAMLVPVAADTPYDILFWQHWTPNPGLRRILRQDWDALQPYVDSVLEIGMRHPAVIAFDVMNEPACLFDIPQDVARKEA